MSTAICPDYTHDKIVNIDTDCLLSMLAVMTMNVGYFMSVLGGVFLGSLFVGRYINSHFAGEH